jgi:hypothetical protein
MFLQTNFGQLQGVFITGESRFQVMNPPASHNSSEVNTQDLVTDLNNSMNINKIRNPFKAWLMGPGEG